jgi:hypothetical protein
LGDKVVGAEKNNQRGAQKKPRIRVLKLVLAIVVVLVALLVFLVPLFVSSEKGRQIILAKINDSIDGEADFATLSMSWWKGVKVTDVSFKDGAGQTLVEVKQIATKPHYGWLLIGRLSFGETEILEPKVEINLKGKEAKRDEESGDKASAEKKRKTIALPIRKIDVVVNGGSLKVTGRGRETVEVAGINSRLTILPLSMSSGKLGFTKAEYMGLHFGPTEADIQIHNDLVRIGPFSTKVNNGQFNFAGEADFKQRPTLLRTTEPIEIMRDIQINTETTRKLLMYLNPIFANAVSVSGVANFNCERLAIPLAGGTENDIEVIGTISISQLRLQASDLLGQILSVAGSGVRGQDITISPTRFVLQDGFLRYDDMQMVVGDNPVNFRGAIGLDKSLDMVVTLPYTTRGRTARVGKEIKGRRISLPIKGSIDRPELDLGKLLEEQLKIRLEERLKEKLKGQLGEELLGELEELFKQ